MASYLLAAFAIAHLIAQFVVTPLQPQPATYSQFLQAVDAGWVVEVAIGAEEVVWREAPGAVEDAAGAVSGGRFRADRIPGMDDSPVLERLQAAVATFLGAGVALRLWCAEEVPRLTIADPLGFPFRGPREWFRRRRRHAYARRSLA